MLRRILVLTSLLVVACAQIAPVAVQPPPIKDAQAIVLDIDGTLTPHDALVFVARPGAAKAVSAFASKGYEIIYISVRVPMFQAGLKDWLRVNGFPTGVLHVAQTTEERASPEIFKAALIDAYSRSGWRIAYAYGDSSTDFAAYAKARIPQERVYALKRLLSSDCQVGRYHLCLDNWNEHFEFVQRDVSRAK